MSIDQLQEFHQARRVLKAIAPDFRILSDDRLATGESVLDLADKVVGVSESTPIKQAIGALLFQMGHLALRSRPEFSLFFGVGIGQWKGTEDALISRLADQGVQADLEAAAWAADLYCSYWHADREEADAFMGLYVWTRDQWLRYFTVPVSLRLVA